MRKAAVVLVAIVACVLIVWYVTSRMERPAPPEEISEIERVREVTLNFGSADAGSLVPEYRQVTSSGKVLDNLRSVVEALISGPGGDRVPTIPSSVRLLGVYIHEKTAFIDFSSEIIEDFSGGTAAEYMLVASVVQTVCANFPGVDAVRILVAGEEVDTIGGHLLISRPLRPVDWR